VNNTPGQQDSGNVLGGQFPAPFPSGCTLRQQAVSCHHPPRVLSPLKTSRPTSLRGCRLWRWM
jgi:hypothetical protein